MTESAPQPSSLVLPATILGVFSLLVGVDAYETELQNVRVIAPLQDACTAHLYVWIPVLSRFPDHAWFVVSGVTAALASLAAAAVYLAFSRFSGGAERRLKQLNENKRAHVAGFVS